VHAIIGTRMFGMVASALSPGRDQPFIIDLSANVVVPLAGVGGATNQPISPTTTGDWTPPTIANVGVYVIVTHPGFAGMAGGNCFGVFDLTNPGAPVWSMQTTGTNALPGLPVAVANFNDRAYFAVGNTTYYTDELLLNRANASQAIVCGDSTAINALSGLPIQTTSSGVTSGLLVFKPAQIWQITGDTTTSNLDNNFLSLNVGTLSPRTIAQAPTGTYFLSTAGGPYIINLLGGLQPLTHDFGATSIPDVQVPFQNALTPSRWAGAYITSVYRVCGPTVIQGVPLTFDYWFDEHRRRWNGPHTFVYDCASAYGNSFVLTSVLNPGLVLQNFPVPGLSPTYTDLNNPYPCDLQSCTFPETGDMCTHQVVESQIELGGAPAGATYTLTAIDERGVQIGATLTPMVVASSGGTIWGSGPTWGSGPRWTSGQNQAPYTYAVNWTAPIVFEKMAIDVQTTAGPNVLIGTFYARFQKTGYMTMKQAV
jgi:hypothetical protein